MLWGEPLKEDMISILRAVSLVAGLSRKNTERVSADISEAKNLKPVGFGAAVCVCISSLE